MLLNNRVYQYGFVGLVSCSYLIVSASIQAQPVTSDGSLPTQVQTSDNLNFNIAGGSQVGDNLFHSFENFSVPENGSASFVNGDVNNIINRVTGRSISKIDGLIKANGDANLFLINPNGIIFGRNASLDVGGSFLATTASAIQFADGVFFSATDFQTQPILTVSVPIGLQFGETPGSISSQSQVTRSSPNGGDIPVGLEVKPGNTLALVGGEIALEGGIITSPEGRIELGSVDSFSFVNITTTGAILTLGYEDVNNFQDIRLTQSASIDTSGFTDSGDIHLRGRQIFITDNSGLFSVNFGNNEGGEINIYASELLELNTNSKISTESLSLPSISTKGSAGDIFIKTERLTINDSSSIRARTFSEGRGGNINIDASEFININGNGFLTTITTESNLGGGNAGNIRLTTGKLFLRDGGQVSSSTFAVGKAGDVIIDTAEFIEISGQGENSFGELVSSAIFSETSGRFSTNTGNGGTLKITTGRLNVQDKGKISVGAVNGSEGKAGSLKINAQEINLNNGSLIAETKAGDQGNITLSNVNTLLLRNNSQITTNATEQATGGDIKINSNTIALLNNSNITANAVQGRGGNITITTQGLFQEPDSKIEATSEENIDGRITINDPDVDPTSGINELPTIPVDAATIFAQDLCKLEDGKVAKGSSFIITGRGGLTPTAEDFLGNVNNVVGWAKRDDIIISQNGTVGVRQRSKTENLSTNYPVIQQSQGWVTTVDGSVWLVANVPEIIPQNSRIVHPNCATQLQETFVK
ncbi:MAG: filamentous hemagglutinin N-terminal domain-containing protein [Xenococcaceae cyanobacterium MO_188.B19]|nr:filamentous hemagglutinin N-terminal domain-containing protein [Xenococcaceae cyanobacterium MO_188.B19]